MTPAGNFSPARLRKARGRRGFTLRDLALKSGVPIATLNSWEVGRRTPSAPLLLEVATALGIEVGDLVPVAENRMVLADARIHRGLSKQRAAELTGVSPTQWSNIEGGYREPSGVEIPLIAAALGITDDEVVALWTRGRRRLTRRLDDD